jgi:hypothetical protein
MKFKVDENLPVEVVSVLCDAGHDAISVVEMQSVLLTRIYREQLTASWQTFARLNSGRL